MHVAQSLVKAHINETPALKYSPKVGGGVSAPGARISETPAYTLPPPSPDALGEGGRGDEGFPKVEGGVSAPGRQPEQTSCPISYKRFPYRWHRASCPDGNIVISGSFALHVPTIL